MMTVEIVSDRVHLFVEAHPPGSPFQLAGQFKAFTARHCGHSSRTRGLVGPRCGPGLCIAPTVGVVPGQTVRGYTGARYEQRWRKQGSQ
jgi:REP element-mobilizing transposase RayT